MNVAGVLLCFMMCGQISEMYAQDLLITDNVAVSPIAGGWYPWYELHVDPDNHHNLMLCGSRWDAQDNAQYGFVYSSVDEGKNWRLALEDKHSAWVSEESCAFGVNGVAYFIADASKIDNNGTPQHERGTSHIYVSRDAGQTWKERIATGWTDYSSSVVETNPGSDQNRLYTFFNDPWIYYQSLGNKEAADKLPSGGNAIGVISYRDGDPDNAPPIANLDMPAMKSVASYPAPAFALNDGSLLTFFTSHFTHEMPNGSKSREYIMASLSSDPARRTLKKPVTIVSYTPKEGEASKCGFGLTSGAAYDPTTNGLYLVYPITDDGSCRLMLTTSADGGESWTTSKRISLPGETLDSVYGRPALAINGSGVLGLMWEDGRSGCWYFAVSLKADSQFTSTKRLNDCNIAANAVEAIKDSYLWTVPYQAPTNDPDGYSTIAIRNMKNAVWRNSHSIAVTPDGTFHPAWIDASDGRGEIRTAAIKVVSGERFIASEITTGVSVSNKVAVLYGGAQHYDEKSGILTLTVTFRNNSNAPVRGPFKLEVVSVDSAYLKTEVANSTNHATGGGAVWDVSDAMPEGVLAPGATSRPYTLSFHTSPKGHFTLGDVLTLSTRLYAKGQ